MSEVTYDAAPSVAVIIVAGGKGSRMGGNENKLFLPLGDSCILGETLRVWQGISQVGQSVVVCADGEREIVSNLCRKQQITKAVLPVIGGKERQDSVWQGLVYLQSRTPPPDFVAIHDGARPFYDGRTFGDFLQTVVREKAAGGVLAVAVQDTVKTVAAGCIMATIPREHLVAAQTPQLFHFSTLFRCYEKALEEGAVCTDDASVLEWCGRDVLVYAGQKENMKITTPEDYDYALYLSARRKKEAGICE